MTAADPLFEFLLRQGDNALVLGHRVSEWCGMGPALEEDIALANVALDLIGQAQMWLGLAGEIEGAGRTADALAYHRDPANFRSTLLVEQPNGDFGRTMMRQFLFDAFHAPWLAALARSTEPRVAEIAAKAAKEAAYHLDRSRGTLIALGDGTDGSRRRMQAALDLLWPFAGEVFATDAVDTAMADAGTAPAPADLHPAWHAAVSGTMAEATLTLPETAFAHSGGRTGKRHSEHLGHMLAVMQSLPRAHPDATW